MESIYQITLQRTPTTSPTLDWRHAGAPRHANGSGMAIGTTPGCTHPWHRTSHARAARHGLRRYLLWPPAPSSGCSARRWWAGISLRDNADVAPSAAGGYCSSVARRERVIPGTFESGWRVCVCTYLRCAIECCICGANRPESASVWMSAIVMSPSKKGKIYQEKNARDRYLRPGIESTVRGLRI